MQPLFFSLISIYVLLFPGALLVSVQDLAMCEQAEQTTVQELNDVDADLPNVTVPEAGENITHITKCTAVPGNTWE